jgi:hypothetical protein
MAAQLKATANTVTLEAAKKRLDEEVHLWACEILDFGEHEMVEALFGSYDITKAVLAAPDGTTLRVQFYYNRLGELTMIGGQR